MQLIFHPLVALPNLLFGGRHRRGSPSRIEGLGSSIDGGLGNSSPAGLDRVQGFIFLPCIAWFGGANKPRRARPNKIWYNVLDQIIGSS
ncbi:hypothetical protein AT260_20915 [Bacillus wiedmannii]|nr:hypothetical protein AT260_20915 [Bacillus wiedmannii]